MLVAVVLAFIAGIGCLLPRGYDISAQTTIADQPSAVYDRIDKLQDWKSWSHFNPDKIDSLQIEYGADGTSQSWTDVRGSGKLWFTDQVADKKVAYKLRFANFPEMDSTIELDSEGERTKVTWRSSGRLPWSPFYGFFRGVYENGMQMKYQQSLELLKAEVEGLEVGAEDTDSEPTPSIGK